MSPHGCAAARRLVAPLGVMASIAGCGHWDARGGGAGAEGGAPTGGTTADGGDTMTGGGEGGEAGAPSNGGAAAGGSGGADAGASGDSGTECVRHEDCAPFSDCYSTSCQSGSCVGSPLRRGSACATGFCNGLAWCLPCLDDAPSGEEDMGCREDSPVCAETTTQPRCVECEEDSDCGADGECAVARCRNSTCETIPLPVGTTCGGGVCNGQPGADGCVPCLDERSSGVDTGCTADRPACDTSKSPAECSCQFSIDCDDGNECTADSCRDGVCERVTLPSGTPCTYGYCNGVPGAEVCVPKPCQTDANCDDRVACTADVCEAGFCAYTADHGQCTDSADVCKPNLCTVGTGCRQFDLSRPRELLANGDFDAGNVVWTETSAYYSQVIYHFDYIPTMLPHTVPNVAWLGGGEGLMDEYNSLSQTVRVPAGTVRLELSFFYQIWTAELPDDHNHMQVRLRSTGANQSDEAIVTFYNQDRTRVWTGFRASLNASAWAGSDATLEFSGTGIDGFTHFFVDSISLLATVCE